MKFTFAHNNFNVMNLEKSLKFKKLKNKPIWQDLKEFY